MSSQVVDAVSTFRPSGLLNELPEESLIAATEDLALLRFSILLTANWSESGKETANRRAELAGELSDLRQLYLDKVDEIAMIFGVDKAMSATEEVERSVRIPCGMEPGTAPADAEELYF